MFALCYGFQILPEDLHLNEITINDFEQIIEKMESFRVVETREAETIQRENVTQFFPYSIILTDPSSN